MLSKGEPVFKDAHTKSCSEPTIKNIVLAVNGNYYNSAHTGQIT